MVAGVSGADLVLDVNGYLAAGIAQRFTGGSLANVGSPSTRYGPVMGGGGSFGFPDAVESLMPTACLAQEFRVRTSRPVIAGEGVDVILVVDGVGRLGCTVLVGNAECNTGTNTAAIPADALVVMKGDFTVLSAIRASYGFVCT